MRLALPAHVRHARGVPWLALLARGRALPPPLHRLRPRLLEAVHAGPGLPLRPLRRLRRAADRGGLPRGPRVYANRKGEAEDAVVVEVAPPATGTVQWHDDAPAADEHHRLSWYADAEEETHTYAHPTYTSYSYQQSYDLHRVSDETTWFPNQSYQQVYNDEGSLYQEFLSCHQDSEISPQPIFSYNQHFGEQPLHIHVEPPETVSSHKLEYYENFSTYDYQNDVNSLENSRQSYEIQPYVHMPYDQVEPYKPSWSLNSGYYQACTEGITPEYDNHALASGECWDMSSLFMSPFYPQETHTYEQSHGDWNV